MMINVISVIVCDTVANNLKRNVAHHKDKRQEFMKKLFCDFRNWKRRRCDDFGLDSRGSGD